MVRPLRIQYKGAVYHIMSRGNLKECIFPKEDDKALFLKLLARGTERYKVKVFAYCLMENHYHLLIQITEENLPVFMHYLGSSYANYLVRGGWVGHVFAARYKSICIEEEEYLLILSRYIHLNPVEASIVERPEEYLWSSYRCLLDGADSHSWLQKDWLFDYFGPGFSEAIVRYREFVEADLEGKPFYPHNEIVAQALLGSEEFLARIKSFMESKAWAKEATGRRFLMNKLSLEEVNEGVCRCAGLDDLRTGDYRNDKDYRYACDLLVHICREYTPSSNSDIAEYLGGIKVNSVSHRYARTKKRLAEDVGYQAKFNKDMERILGCLRGKSLGRGFPV